MRRAIYSLKTVICLWALCALGFASLASAEVSDPDGAFAEGNADFEAGNYEAAVEQYRLLLPAHQSAALYYNLGNAEYKLDDYLSAILHLEKARALDPSNPDIRANLKLARDAAQISAPELSLLEKLALGWSVNGWTWLAVVGFWGFLALVLLPRMWGWRGPLLRATVVLLGLAFLVSALALLGYHHLGKTGIALSEDVALRLSPTSNAPAKEFLKPGEAAFIQRRHGDFFYVETDSGKSGWVSAKGFEPVWD